MVDYVKKYRAGLLPLALLFLVFLNWITRRKANAGTGTIKYDPNNQKSNSIIEFFKGTEYSQIAPLLSAQTQHETGNFTSNIFRTQNNLFGMKHANGRVQLGVNDGREHRTYANVTDSMRDQLAYLRQVNFPTEVSSVQEFVTELQKRDYFKAPISEYYGGVNAFYNRNKL